MFFTKARPLTQLWILGLSVLPALPKHQRQQPRQNHCLSFAIYPDHQSICQIQLQEGWAFQPRAPQPNSSIFPNTNTNELVLQHENKSFSTKDHVVWMYS